MKIIRDEHLVSVGTFSKSNECAEIQKELVNAINAVTSNERSYFIINPVRRGNGVVPIKSKFIAKLKTFGWEDEVSMSLAKGMNPGPIDVVKTTKLGKYAVEWETGNISSSHRALNKIAVGIIQGEIIGGTLILPVKLLAKYLTDRIGNYEEIAPYFPLYQNLHLMDGFISVIGIQHDGESDQVPLIPKGKDGNAKK